MAKLILIIEDEAGIVEICRDYLQAVGFEAVAVSDGPSGLASVKSLAPDLVVLDLMLPGLDGLEICRQIRQESDLPIIILTAKHKESDKLIGLETGADDYITKPFSPRELVARVRTVLRRSGAVDKVKTLRLDRDHYRAVLPWGVDVNLTPTEFDILATLASEPGQIFSRAQILTATHGVTFKSYERAIDSHIRNLRKKIDPQGVRGSEADEGHIVTVHGYGYKFVE
ncbi:MAG: response regulator transcription factor [Anaerolineaceae bacterium]